VEPEEGDGKVLLDEVVEIESGEREWGAGFLIILRKKEDMNKKSNFWTIIIFLIFIGWIVALFNPSKDSTPEYSSAPAPAPAATPENADLNSIELTGGMLAMRAVRMDAKDPEGVEFKEKISERYYPATGVYWAKYRIVAANGFGVKGEAIAVGTVRFNGGKINDELCWTILNGKIED
jgi:hypothetical protein